MAIQTKTRYTTTDGKEFLTYEEAEKHELVANWNGNLKVEVIELLNKALLHCDKVEISVKGASPDESYLLSVKEIVKNLIKGNASVAEQYINDYYSSSQDC